MCCVPRDGPDSKFSGLRRRGRGLEAEHEEVLRSGWAAAPPLQRAHELLLLDWPGEVCLRDLQYATAASVFAAESLELESCFCSLSIA